MSRKIGSVLFGLILLFSVMPWVSVDCGGVTIEASGLDLATGPDVGTQGTDEEADPEFFAILALLLGVAGTALFLVRGSAGHKARILIGVLGVVALFALKIKVESDINAESSSGEIGDLYGLIQVKWEAGFWLAIVSFAIAAGIQLLAFREEDEIAGLKWDDD